MSKQVLYHGPDHIYSCMYCTVFVTVFVTTAKFYGMNISLVRLKSSTLQKFSQLRSRISTLNLKWFLYIWLLKYKISACRFLNHWVLIGGFFYCTPMSLLIRFSNFDPTHAPFSSPLHFCSSSPTPSPSYACFATFKCPYVMLQLPLTTLIQ